MPAKKESLPENRKLWRVSILLDTEGAGKKWFSSDLMSKGGADEDRLYYERAGVKAEVIEDRDAIKQYIADKEAQRLARSKAK